MIDLEEFTKMYLEPAVRAIGQSIEDQLNLIAWMNMTDAMIAEQLLAEGQADTILTEAKEAGYVVVAFNVTTDLIPLSLNFAWNRGKTSITPLDQRDAHGMTFAMPGPAYSEERMSGPRIWGIVTRILQGASCGHGGDRGHQYQLAPNCGKRVYVLEDGAWTRLE